MTNETASAILFSLDGKSNAALKAVASRAAAQVETCTKLLAAAREESENADYAFMDALMNGDNECDFIPACEMWEAEVARFERELSLFTEIAERCDDILWGRAQRAYKRNFALYGGAVANAMYAHA